MENLLFLDFFRHFRQMKLILTAVTGLAILNLLITGCSSQSNTQELMPEQPTMATTATEVNPVIFANTRFGFKLFTELYRQKANENIFISPASINAALSMTYNGAKAETQSAIANTLEIANLPLEQVNQGHSNLQKALTTADPKVQINIANSLWLNKTTAFLPDFIQRVAESYSAKLTQLDFSDSNSLATINNWVKTNTNDKIEKMSSKLNRIKLYF